MFERFTEKARRAIFFARYEASEYGSKEISSEHLLLGLLREAKELFPPLLPSTDTIENLRAEIDKQIERGPAVSTSVDMPLNRDASLVLTRAKEEADRLAHQHIGTEHLLLAILGVECIAAQVLKAHGLHAANIRGRISKSPSVGSLRVRPYSVPVPTSSRDVIEIHGIRRNAETIRARVAECRTFSWHWRRQQWTSRDVAVERNTGQISFDLSLAENTDAFDIASQAWKYDLCAICRWRLQQSPEAEHSTGYTNGRDWVCVECYDKFLGRGDYFRSSYGEIT